MTPDLPEPTSNPFKLVGRWIRKKSVEYEHQARVLQEASKPPKSWAETINFGKSNKSLWDDHKAARRFLATLRDIRASGGIIATLLEIRSLMVFGVGGEWQAENDDMAAWLEENMPGTDVMMHDIGLDCYTYGYSLAEVRETQAGDFHSLEFIQPWTTTPETDQKGKVIGWEQLVKQNGSEHKQAFNADELVHFRTMKRSARDEIGMSLLARAKEPAEAFRRRQRSIDNAIQLYGFPKMHAKLGRENGPVIDDNELRRARPMFQDMDEETMWITGNDVEIDFKTPETFDFTEFTQQDLAKLAIVFMLPLELTQLGGGEGLGSGFPARVRERMFLLSAKAHQSMLSKQLGNDVAKMLLTKYGDFSEEAVDEAGVTFVFDEPITDMDEVKAMIDAIGDDMTVNERRSKFDQAPLEDEETGEQFLSPGKEARLDKQAEQAPSQDEPLLFQQVNPRHDLQEDDFWWEDHIDYMLNKVAFADNTERTLFGFSEGQTPQFIQQRMLEEVLEGGPIFSKLETIADQDLMNFRLFMAGKLTEDGWTISEMTDEIQTQFGVDPNDAETLARSTTQNMVSNAAEEGYRSRDDFDELRFKWPAIGDGRDSDICLEIVDRVPPEGLHLDELKTLVHEVAKKHDNEARGWTPHPSCRRRPIRVTN